MNNYESVESAILNNKV